jgi:hypothetical protein
MVQEQHSEQENDKNSSNTKMPVIKVVIPGMASGNARSPIRKLPFDLADYDNILDYSP